MMILKENVSVGETPNETLSGSANNDFEGECVQALANF